MLNDRQKIKTTTLALTALDTEYGLSIPDEAQDLRLVLEDATKAWRYSSTAGEVAGGGGSHVAAGGTVTLSGPFSSQTIYVAAANNAQVLDFSYSRPTRLG